MATLAWLLAEPHRDRKRRPEPFSPADFMARPGPRAAAASAPPADDAAAMLQIAEQLTKALGGKDLRKKKSSGARPRKERSSVG